MRKPVILVTCERCGRPEHVDPGDKPLDPVQVLLGTTASLSYQDLCTPCRSTVMNAIEMMKPTNKKSPIRTKVRLRAVKTPTTTSPEEKKAEGTHGHPGPLRAPRG